MHPNDNDNARRDLETGVAAVRNLFVDRPQRKGPFIVMLGLGPGIHLSGNRQCQVCGGDMDCRVKPGNNDGGWTGFVEHAHPAFALTLLEAMNA